MSKHPSLTQDPADLIAGRWAVPTGPRIESRNPARPDELVWAGHASTAHVDAAVAAARAALPAWSRTPQAQRFDVLRTFKRLTEQHADRIATLICDETGKALWDAKQEAAALPAKIDITLDATPVSGPLNRVTGFELPLAPTRTGRAWFRPHGVMAVVAPFNFPAHLPNGHIVPALAMGNTVVLKPSDKTPAVGQLLAELLHEALTVHKAPPGVVNLVQGAADVAAALVAHEDIDGVLFTGSWPVGRRIMQANLDRPGRVLALEMGGNNAAIVMADADLRQAAIECARSAYVTTGQRCTCTRRLIVHESVAARLLHALAEAARSLTLGDPRAATPVFMGPLISAQARQAVLDFQSSAAAAGAKVLVEARPTDTPAKGHFITPGLIHVDRFVPFPPVSKPGAPVPPGADVEIFGPLLRVSTFTTLDDAIDQANATNYGLAASIFTKDNAAAERFLHEARAGCINLNTGTAGASSKLPFGGLGLSGNHRPAGAFSLDYCAYPVAGMLESGNAAAMPPGMRFDDAWLN